ncbi:hypothetical protein GME_12494 [Halomonas sp. TD01]|nr:hypothetical protein GME_12494 [Halomonas sp. TD01]
MHHPGSLPEAATRLFVELRDDVRRIDAFDWKTELFAIQL